jgi:hypothetical protein
VKRCPVVAGLTGGAHGELIGTNGSANSHVLNQWAAWGNGGQAAGDTRVNSGGGERTSNCLLYNREGLVHIHVVISVVVGIVLTASGSIVAKSTLQHTRALSRRGRVVNCASVKPDTAGRKRHVRARNRVSRRQQVFLELHLTSGHGGMRQRLNSRRTVRRVHEAVVNGEASSRVSPGILHALGADGALCLAPKAVPQANGVNLGRRTQHGKRGRDSQQGGALGMPNPNIMSVRVSLVVRNAEGLLDGSHS